MAQKIGKFNVENGDDQSLCRRRQVNEATVVLPEADLGMFSMFGRTGAAQKRGPHKRTWAENNHVITKYSVNVG